MLCLLLLLLFLVQIHTTFLLFYNVISFNEKYKRLTMVLHIREISCVYFTLFFKGQNPIGQRRRLKNI